MKRKKIALSLAVIMLMSSMAGCQIDQPKGDNSSTQLPNVSSNVTDIEGYNKAQSYEIVKNINVTPLLADKDGTDMTDEEIKSMAKKLFENCSNMWLNLYYGVVSTPVDESDFIIYDESTWYRVVYITSLDKYKKIIDSSFEYEAYENFIYPAIKGNMHEENGVLYHCPEKVGAGGGFKYITPLSIEVSMKQSDKITLKVTVEEGVLVQKDGEYIWEDGDKIYTILKQDGYWVLETFDGKQLQEVL